MAGFEKKIGECQKYFSKIEKNFFYDWRVLESIDALGNGWSLKTWQSGLSIVKTDFFLTPFRQSKTNIQPACARAPLFTTPTEYRERWCWQ